MNTKKQLVVGNDYSFCFRLPEWIKMVYRGGDTWECVHPAKGSKTAEAPGQTKAALEYINRQSVHTARW